MSSPIINRVPFLRTTWDFPEEPIEMARVLSRSYLEIASMVNNRIIGIYPTNKPAIGGESWFLTTLRKQNLRQVYTFEGPAPIANIPHNVDMQADLQFTKCFGSFTDTATGNWYGVIFGSNVAIAGQVSFYITPTDIVILADAGAPPISNGLIVLEWIVRTRSNN